MPAISRDQLTSNRGVTGDRLEIKLTRFHKRPGCFWEINTQLNFEQVAHQRLTASCLPPPAASVGATAELHTHSAEDAHWRWLPPACTNIALQVHVQTKRVWHHSHKEWGKYEFKRHCWMAGQKALWSPRQQRKRCWEMKTKLKQGATVPPERGPRHNNTFSLLGDADSW